LLAAYPASNEALLAKERILDGRLHHLRVAGPREWSDFPAQPESANFSLSFPATPNAGEWTLRLRQQDVRQPWKVLLNGKDIGRLATDENDTAMCFAVPAGALRAGDNRLVIEQVGKTPDDIRVGEIVLDDRPPKEVLSAATVDISIAEQDEGGKSTPLPCRLTIVDDRGALATIGAASGEQLAVRPGVIYTGNGRATFGVPAGSYTIYAGRGFAYGIDSVRVAVKPGDVVRKTLSIRREVPTPGYVSCDTHIHTLTYSGHGDATIDERVITLAGEGIELPIATDHNRQISLHETAVMLGVRRWFTPVVGNEVTTSLGHFNIFPVPAGDRIPDYKAKDWKQIFASIQEQTAAKIVILNHPRDLHSGFRPFGPEHHNAVTGANLDGWILQANAMEVVNSGAQQTDPLQLFRDWFGLLNRGMLLTPVGASDSHDVSRFIVGQGRTYIRCNDDDPGNLNVDEAVDNFLKGRVLVSCGLLADITVNGRFGPGDLAPATDEIKVAVRVLGPSWVTADTVALYANGQKIREARIPKVQPAGVKWSGEWTLPRFKHDVHLVAIATGPGISELYWPIAKPYQPASPHVNRRVIGTSGAVWIDGDGDGKRTCARHHAQRLARLASDDPAKLMQSLRECDEAVAAHVAELMLTKGASLQELRDHAKTAGQRAERGVELFMEAWRQSQMARTQPKGAIP
jgi:hypothetical protein